MRKNPSVCPSSSGARHPPCLEQRGATKDLPAVGVGVRWPDGLGRGEVWAWLMAWLMGCSGSTTCPPPGPPGPGPPDIDSVWMWGCCTGTATATGTATVGPAGPGGPCGGPWAPCAAAASVLPGSRGGEMGSLLMRSGRGSGEWHGGGVLLETATCGTLLQAGRREES